jgi:hypothetical protein
VINRDKVVAYTLAATPGAACKSILPDASSLGRGFLKVSQNFLLAGGCFPQKVGLLR